MVEALEPRVVLDAQIGIEASQLASEGNHFEQFESADALQTFLLESAVDRWKDVFGTKINHWPYPYFLDEHVLGDIIVPRTILSAAGDVVGGFDSTNVQVSGVDEGDLVKTDGEYLYIATGERVSVIDARNPAELILAAEISVEGQASELFVHGDRLMLLSREDPIFAFDKFVVGSGFWLPSDISGPRTSVATYDISDRTTPELVGETTVDGVVTASRMKDGFVYLVTADQIRLPRPELQCEAIVDETPVVSVVSVQLVTDSPGILPPGPIEPPVETCVYETEEAYLARISNEIVDLAMPSFEKVDQNGDVIGSGLVSEPTDTYKPLTQNASSVTSIVIFDLSADTGEISGSTGLITEFGSTVYASAQSIYVATTSYEIEGIASTRIQQFAIGENGISIDLAAVGTVPGTLLNQFAMDEYDGHVRMVTSSGWGDDRTNQLFVLQQIGTTLDVVGSIDEIALGESVFAVRFVDDRALVVTFRVIDPLFTIDLSDPTNPTIQGELKIPGFSNYLHPISKDFLLGLGRDDDGFRGSPQLSLFDVSDFSLPQRVDEFVFQDVTWSDAFYDHHAISYFSESQIAVVPFQGFVGLCTDSIEFGLCRPETRSAFWVIQVDTSSEAIHLLGTIEHEDRPLRSLRIGENLYTVSTSRIKVNELRHPDTLIGELDFGDIARMDSMTVDARTHETKLDVLANDRVEDSAVIVEVSATAAGAVVEIDEGGKRLLYTPAENSDAIRDSFEYTVESGGRRATATVQLHIRHENDEDRMVRLAKAHLAERLGPDVSPESIRLVSLARQEWPDACLGGASGSDICAQVITPGFSIVLEYGLVEYVYHTDTTSLVFPLADQELENGHLIQIRVEVVNSTGAPATSLLAGERARLEIHAEDLRSDPQGVFAAYVDVEFDLEQISELGSIDHGATFVHGTSGTISDRGVNEAGGFSPDADPSTTLILSVPFVAAGPGDLRFATDGADLFPSHDSLLLGLDSRIPLDRILFGEAVVEVLPSLHNDADPMDANMDGAMTPLDALVIMNHINRYGSGPVNVEVARALRTAAQEARATRFAVDVNRDGFISPIDVLMIVNALDARTRLAAEGEADAAAVTAAPHSLPLLETLNPSMTLPATACHEALHPAVESIESLASALVQRQGLNESSAEDDFFANLLNADNDDWWVDSPD